MKAKKLIVLTLLAILLLSTFACGGGGGEEEAPLEPGAYLIYQVDSEGIATPELALAELEAIIKEHIYTHSLAQPVVIERTDDDRISIFLPDVKSVETARDMVGSTAQFNLRELIGGQWVIAEVMGRDEEIKPLTGAHLLECHLSYDQLDAEWACDAELEIRFGRLGPDLLPPFTQRNIGKTVGIFIGDGPLIQVEITEKATTHLKIAPLSCWLADYLAETINEATLPLSLSYVGGYVYPPSTEPTGEEPTPTPAAMPEPGYLRYVDETNGFSIWCPQDWYRDEETDLMLNLVSTRSEIGEQMLAVWWFPTVSVNKAYGYATLSLAFNDWKAYAEEMHAYSQIAEERVTVGGVSAMKHVFEYRQEKATWTRVAALLLVKDGITYVIICAAGFSAWDEHELTFDSIMNSFRVLE
ncbi:hypothetical protein ES703_09492 [subsurface metagenome]